MLNRKERERRREREKERERGKERVNLKEVRQTSRGSDDDMWSFLKFDRLRRDVHSTDHNANLSIQKTSIL